MIHGTADALPKPGFRLQGRHPIRISVLDPIPHQRSASMPVDELSDHVRRLIATELGETQPTGWICRVPSQYSESVVSSSFGSIERTRCAAVCDRHDRTLTPFL